MVRELASIVLDLIVVEVGSPARRARRDRVGGDTNGTPQRILASGHGRSLSDVYARQVEGMPAAMQYQIVNRLGG